MSLVSFIGPRPEHPRHRGHVEGQAARGLPADPDQRGPGADPPDRRGQGQPFRLGDDRHHLSVRKRRRRHELGAGRGMRRSRGGRALGRLQHHHPVRSRDRSRPHPDPVAAGDERGAPSPDQAGPAHLRRPRRRDRRGARGASVRDARRLRCRGDQSLSRLRHHRAASARRCSTSEIPLKEAQKRYIKSIDKGLLKVMSKMGISTYQSYCGAQIFDAVGPEVVLREALFHRHAHPGGRRRPASDRARDRGAPPAQAFGDVPHLDGMLDVGGEYAYRIRGEAHMWRPTVVADLQHAVRTTEVEDAMAGRIPQKWRDYARQVNDQSEQLMTLRGLFRIKTGGGDGPKARAAGRGRASNRRSSSGSRPAP